jgi:hypothetical protein
MQFVSWRWKKARVPGQARRRDLAVLADEVAQGVDVLVVDLLDAGDGEAAESACAGTAGTGYCAWACGPWRTDLFRVAGACLTSLLEFDGLDSGRRFRAVALRSEEALEVVLDAELRLAERVCHGADGPARISKASLRTLSG